MVKVTQTRAKKFKLDGHAQNSLVISVNDDGVVSITDDSEYHRPSSVTIPKEMLESLIEILKAESK
jgi:hypothetical protein